MPTLNRNGVNIYYEVHGSGPTMLLTHGFSATAEMWKANLAAVSQKYRVIVWDMRGHGRSEGRRVYVERFADVADADQGGAGLVGLLAALPFVDPDSGEVMS